MIAPQVKSLIAWVVLAGLLFLSVHLISSITGNIIRANNAANDARVQMSALAERQLLAQAKHSAVTGSISDPSVIEEYLTPLSTNLEISNPIPFDTASAAPSSAQSQTLAANVPIDQLDAFLGALAQPGLYVQHLTVDQPDPSGPFRVEAQLVSFAYGVEDGDGT